MTAERFDEILKKERDTPIENQQEVQKSDVHA